MLWLVATAGACADRVQAPASTDDPDAMHSRASVPSVESSAAETPALTIHLVRIGGSSELYEWMTSGRILRHSESGVLELQQHASAVSALQSELLRCGICQLESRLQPAAFDGKQRLIVEVTGQPSVCSADLPKQAWSADARARRCLDIVRAAMQPLAGQCETCGMP
jgi:hypothetical protein